MQKAGSFADAEDLLCRFVIGPGFQKIVSFDGLGDAGLAGFARGTAKRKMRVLNNAVIRQRQFRHIREAANLGHEAQSDTGGDQGGGVRGPAVTAKTFAFI